MLVRPKTYSLIKRYYTLALRKAHKKNTPENILPLVVHNTMWLYVFDNPNIPRSDKRAIFAYEKGKVGVLDHYVESKLGGHVFLSAHKEVA